MQVGSISPAIEIWDLDVLDAVEPLVTLGGEAPAASAADGSASEGAAIKKKKKKSKVLNKHEAMKRPGSHTSASLGNEKTLI